MYYAETNGAFDCHQLHHDSTLRACLAYVQLFKASFLDTAYFYPAYLLKGRSHRCQYRRQECTCNYFWLLFWGRQSFEIKLFS